jgi:hypothetical protein
MTLNFKALALAFAVVFATSAVTASLASADSLVTEGGISVSVRGKESGTGDVLTTTAGTVKCKEILYGGSIPSPVTTFSLTPQYPVKTAGGEQNCTGFGFPAEVTASGCWFLFHIGAATTGTVDIVCEPGHEITITASSIGKIKCVVHIPSQNSKGTITYKNIGSSTTRELEIEANLSTLSYSHTAGELGGLGSCTSGSATVGSYSGKMVLTAEKIGTGQHVGIFLV